MFSGEAINAAQAELIRRNLGFIAFDEMRAALDAAAAVDGDAQWNAAIVEAAEAVTQFGVRHYTAEEVAARIMNLKRG